jgi:hypothetical protein
MWARWEANARLRGAQVNVVIRPCQRTLVTRARHLTLRRPLCCSSSCLLLHVQADKDPWNTYFEFFGDLPTLIKPRRNALDPMLSTEESGSAADFVTQKTVAMASANVEGILE